MLLNFVLSIGRLLIRLQLGLRFRHRHRFGAAALPDFARSSAATTILAALTAIADTAVVWTVAKAKRAAFFAIAATVVATTLATAIAGTVFATSANDSGNLVAAFGAALQKPIASGEPDALIHGSARDTNMIVIGSGRLDDDDIDDLVLGELPTGVFGDETGEPSILLGRESWPVSAGIETLAPKRIVLPTLGDDDSFEILGLGDLNGDGRDDIVSFHVRRTSTRVLSTRVGIHFSPETWPGRPSFVRPDVTIEPDELSLYRRAVVADVNGDGAGDLLLERDGGADLVIGRSEWPSSVGFDAGVTRFTPEIDRIHASDVVEPGLDTLFFDLLYDGGDVAMVHARPSWLATFDLLTESDVVVGTGEARWGAFMPGDVDGSPGPDFAMIDRGSRALQVYHGGADLADRLGTRGGEDWAIDGISLSIRIDVLDLDGDGVNEVVVDGTKIFLGGPGRSGVFDVSAGEYDAEWADLPEGSLWPADVNGDGFDDAVFNDPAADGPGRANAGRLAILFGPRLAPRPTSTSEPTATSDVIASPTTVPTPDPTSDPDLTPGPTSDPEPTPTEGGGGRLHLPLVWARP